MWHRGWSGLASRDSRSMVARLKLMTLLLRTGNPPYAAVRSATRAALAGGCSHEQTVRENGAAGGREGAGGRSAPHHRRGTHEIPPARLLWPGGVRDFPGLVAD